MGKEKQETKTKVNIRYTHAKGIVKNWDDAFQNVMFGFSMTMIGTGFNMKTGERDLSFRPETEAEFLAHH